MGTKTSPGVNEPTPDLTEDPASEARPDDSPLPTRITAASGSPGAPIR